MSEVSRSWTMPDAHALPALYDTTCGTCANYQKAAQEYVDNGERFSSQIASVTSIEVTHEMTDRIYFDMVVHQNAAPLVDASGRTLRHLDEGDLTFQTGAIWKNDRWLLIALATQS